MKIVRWILGFPLAFIIAVFISFIVSDCVKLLTSDSDIDITYLHFADYCGLTCGVGLWIFLTSWFIPSNKKITTAIISVIITCILLFALVDTFFSHHIDNETRKQEIYIALAMLGSVIISFFVSYHIFKDNGWKETRPPNRENEIERLYEEQMTSSHRQEN